MIRRFKNSEKICEIQAGSLLISTPVNNKFESTKILTLITQHNESGTTGIILNKDLPGSTVIKCLYGNNQSGLLHYGGPDEYFMDSYLIIYPSLKNGWKDSIYWSYDPRDVETILHFMSEYNIQVGAYKGCIKWAPEEIEAELEKKMWWFTNEYTISSVLQPNQNTWKAYAKMHGGFYAPLIEGDLMVCRN